MDIKRLQQFGTLKNYKRGHVLFRMGDEDSSMYIILKGRVSLRHKIGDRIEGEMLNAGKFFGETSVILKRPKMHTCVIEEEGTTLICMPRTSFESFISEDPEFSMHIMTLLSEQLRKSMEERENFILRLRKHEPEDEGPDMDMETPLAILKEAPQKVTEGDPSLPEAMQSLVILGAAPPEHKSYGSKNWPNAISMISPKSMTCPICEKKFTTTYLSRSRLGTPTTAKDMRRTYKDIEPIYFDLYTCGKCGYSNFSEEFEKIRTALKPRLQKALSGVGALPFDLDENIFNINYVFLKLYLAVFCAENMGGKVLATPKTWLRISWLYEDVGDSELSLFAAKRAYDAYLDMLYNTKTFTGEAEMEVMLLMGELAMKLGMEKEAAKLFWEVLHSRSVNDMQRKRAESRIYDIRYKDENAY